MATYYVSKSGSASYDGTVPFYISGTTGPKLTIAQGLALMAKGDTLKILPGTYAEAITITANGTGVEEANRYTIDAYGGGYVIWKPNSGSFALDMQGDYWFVNRVIFDGTDRGISLTALVRNYLGDGCRYNYCILRNYQKPTSYAFYQHTAVGVQLNNCEVSGNLGGGILATSSSILTIRNTVISGNNAGDSLYGIRVDSGCTVDIDYSICCGNGSVITKETSAIGTLTTGANFFTDRIAMYQSYPLPHILSLTFDDYASGTTYIEDIAGYAAAKGIGITWFVVEYDILANMTNYASRLQSLVAAGHEVAIHGQSHQSLTLTNAMTINYIGAAAAATMTIANNTLTLTTTGGVDDHTIDLTDVATDRLSELVAVINGYTGKYTCTKHANADNNIMTIDLEDITDQDIKTSPYLALFNRVKMVQNEVGLCKSWLTTVLGSAPTTIAYPASLSDAVVWANVRDLAETSLLGGRGPGVATEFRMPSVTLYCTNHVTPVLTGTETEIRVKTRSWCEWLKGTNQFYSTITHNIAEIPLINWTYILDEIRKANMAVLTYAQAVAAIRADHSTADNLTWTKSYTDMSDFRKSPQSPCINAGISVGLTVDILGNAVGQGGAPDIGAYENNSSGAWFNL
jgi:hypothetical protein